MEMNQGLERCSDLLGPVPAFQSSPARGDAITGAMKGFPWVTSAGEAGGCEVAQRVSPAGASVWDLPAGNEDNIIA